MAGARLGPVRIGERCVQFRAKRLEFHRSLECLELVTEIAQPLQAIIDIEKSRLPSHRIISEPSVTMESERRRIGEVLRSIQLTVEHVHVHTGGQAIVGSVSQSGRGRDNDENRG
jgi:hypothetical protein